VDGRQRAAWRTAGRTEVGRAPVTSRPRRRMAGLCPGTASYARAPSTSLWSPRVGRDDGESCLQHSTSMAAFIGRSRECYRRWPVLVACTESACRVVCSAMLFCCGAVVVVPINYGANQRSTGIACTVLVVVPSCCPGDWCIMCIAGRALSRCTFNESASMHGATIGFGSHASMGRPYLTCLPLRPCQHFGKYLMGFHRTCHAKVLACFVS
jgi:hypothetical protein